MNWDVYRQEEKKEIIAELKKHIKELRDAFAQADKINATQHHMDI